MHSRTAIALAIAASGLGFAVGYGAVGYGWPRGPAENNATSQLLSLAENIASNVVGIQQQLEREASQCIEQPAASVQAASADAQRNPRQVADDTAAARETARLQQQAEALVARGLSYGRWTDGDARELRSAMNGLPSAQQQVIVAPLLQAINAQQVNLEVAHGGAL
jgi:hypothetical protein